MHAFIIQFHVIDLYSLSLLKKLRKNRTEQHDGSQEKDAAYIPFHKFHLTARTLKAAYISPPSFLQVHLEAKTGKHNFSVEVCILASNAMQQQACSRR